MSGPAYEHDRPARLVELLRAIADRIRHLEDDDLLAAGPELQKLLGDARAELFRYEVRFTYDTQEAAESRRIVANTKKQMNDFDSGSLEGSR